MLIELELLAGLAAAALTAWAVKGATTGTRHFAINLTRYRTSNCGGCIDPGADQIGEKEIVWQDTCKSWTDGPEGTGQRFAGFAYSWATYRGDGEIDPAGFGECKIVLWTDHLCRGQEAAYSDSVNTYDKMGVCHGPFGGDAKSMRLECTNSEWQKPSKED